MTHLIIDGYNFLHQDLGSGLEHSLEHAREKLITRLALYKTLRGNAVTVVFDGNSALSEFSPAYKKAGISIKFTPSGITADEEIARLVAKQGAQATVVSSDRQVQLAAKSAGAVFLTASEFLSKLILAERSGQLIPKEKNDSRVHKRWSTKKVGPSKKLPKALRRKKQKLKNL